MRLSSHEIAYCALQAGFSEQDALTMTAIILANNDGETEFLWQDYNTGKQYHGLAAINSETHSELLGMANWRDPLVNLEMAHVVFQKGGFTNWEKFVTHEYKLFLTIAHLGIENPIKPPVTVESEIERISQRLDALETLVIDSGDNAARIQKNTGQMVQEVGQLTEHIEQVRKHFS